MTTRNFTPGFEPNFIDYLNTFIFLSLSNRFKVFMLNIFFSDFCQFKINCKPFKNYNFLVKFSNFFSFFR